MTGESPEELFARSLAAPVDELVVPAEQALAPQAQRWELPAGDRSALARWGLPAVPESRLAVAVQDAEQPRLRHGDQRLYALATMPNLEIGAVAGGGAVLGVRASVELPAVFAASLPPVVYVNASAALFVEWSWRWYWAERALAELPEDELDARLDELWRRVRAADPGVERDPASSLWQGRLEGG